MDFFSSSAVLLILPGAPSPASLPADARRAALPLQTLSQYRQHDGRGRAALNGHTTSISESQVHGPYVTSLWNDFVTETKFALL